jgi:hypothetical protein
MKRKIFELLIVCLALALVGTFVGVAIGFIWAPKHTESTGRTGLPPGYGIMTNGIGDYTWTNSAGDGDWLWPENNRDAVVRAAWNDYHFHQRFAERRLREAWMPEEGGRQENDAIARMSNNKE